MKQMQKHRLLGIILTILFVAPMYGQIEYSNWNLTLTGDHNAYTGISNSGRKAIQFNHYGGCYWTFKGSFQQFFQLDITPLNPRLAGTGNCIVFYNTDDKIFNSIQVSEVFNHSDARAKTNVADMKSSIATLMNLRPVSFNWKDDATPMRAAAMASEGGATDNEAEKTHYGFLAQEVEEVLPDIVKLSDTGDKLVNYTALIPMLVQAVQELQQTVEAQAQTIDRLESMLPMSKQSANSFNKIISCTPNPTSGYVSIETQIAEGCAGEIVITSIGGNREMLLKIDSPTISCNTSSLPSGIHVVSLYVDGQLADTTRLIKQ